MATDNKYRHDRYVIDGTLRYLGDQNIADLSSAVALTVPDGARMALIAPTGAAVRFRCGGSVPTAGVGIPLDDGEKFWCNIDALSGISFIQQAVAATLDVQYFA